MKSKKKIKIIIPIIIVCVLLAVFFIYENSDLNTKTIELTQTEITQNTDILNEFIKAIDTNNKDLYNSLTDSNMQKGFDEVSSAIKQLGTLHSVTYKETIKLKNTYNLIFSASFSNKSNTQIVLTFYNLNNSIITGIHI